MQAYASYTQYYDCFLLCQSIAHEVVSWCLPSQHTYLVLMGQEVEEVKSLEKMLLLWWPKISLFIPFKFILGQGGSE